MPPSNAHPDATTTRPSVKRRLLFVLRFISQPLLFLAVGVVLLGLLGIAQRVGWISEGGGGAGNQTSTNAAASVDYICPMMCTPPQQEPGRCPVCAMELVAASQGNAAGDERSVIVDPATRRVVNIQTVSAERIGTHRTIRTVGEVSYDESKMKTISAYTDGRFDKMYVDYTGAVVQKGDRLAEFFSPELYSAQVEFLQGTDAVGRRSDKSVIVEAHHRLQENARLRLVELGMSDLQIDHLTRSRKAQTRLDVVAPIHGTVVERLAVEGEYVKRGQPVFRLVDLSTVWLLLELFPSDAAAIRYGQAVEAKLKSIPSRTFTGRVAFIDPEVNEKTRTVSVRVVLNNTDAVIRIGDYAKATIEIPMDADRSALIYDPELANKWISPRHPHVIRDQPGRCELCGVELVPATEFGFTDRPQPTQNALVVPRSAVLSAADESVVYVETETGRFEMRRVVTGATSGGNVVILRGLLEGEKVATAGNFLLDSQMQLAGNPSLIDPSRAGPPLEMIAGFSAKELAEIQQLPDSEQSLAVAQIICPVTEFTLGSMGVPCRVEVNGQAVFICCEACREDVVAEPELHLAKLENYKTHGPSTASDNASLELPEILAIEPAESSWEIPVIEEIEDAKSFEIEIPGELELPGIEGGASK